MYTKVVDMISRPIICATTFLKHNSILHEIYVEKYAFDNDFQDIYENLSQDNKVEELD